MQLNSVYLYSNKFDVYTNALSTEWISERFRRVYNRNLKVYRSVDNRIDLQVRNSDEKSANITGSTVVFNIVTRDTKDLIYSKDCTTVGASNGRVYVVITKDELLDLESGFYNWTLVQEVRNAVDNDEYTVTSRTPLYIDSQYGTIATLEINGDVYGEIEQSLVVNKFEYINPATTGNNDPKYYTSSIIDTKGHKETADSAHTFQFYFTNNYSGTVKIQGSISEGGTPNVWSDITQFDVIDASNTQYKNITGKYNFFRVRHYPTTNVTIAEFTVSQTILGYYSVNIKTGGRGYKVGDIITIPGADLGGETNAQNLTIIVSAVSGVGAITSITWSGNSYNGVKTYVVSGQLPTSGRLDKILYR